MTSTSCSGSHANLTTVLELAGRHEEAVESAKAGIDAARDAGLEAVYGNVLRGNAGDSLFLLGRWEEARAMSMTALEWLPAGVNFLNALVSLATVEIELSAGEAAGRLLGQSLLELEAVRDAQQAVPLHLSSASFALWRGDLADARRAAERGWVLIRSTEDWILAARTASTVLEVEAANASEARERRDLAALAASREGAREVLRAAESIVKRHGVAHDARLAPPRRRLAGHRSCPSPTGRRAGRRGGMGGGRGRVGGPAHPVRDAPEHGGARRRRSSDPARAAPAAPMPASRWPRPPRSRCRSGRSRSFASCTSSRAAR